MSDLRTRIITAMLSEDDVALMADAVIAELGLEREDGEWPFDHRHRYVTDWKADDE